MCIRDSPKFLEKLSVCKDLFYGYDYSKFMTGTDLERAKTISGAVNFIIDREKTDEKDTFLKEALMLHQSLSLCSSTVSYTHLRILSSFFSWLEDEDYILKSPVRRIHKVKTVTNIKETYSDEALELMRDNCTELRDLAIIDMLASTGMRVGEMVLLNRNDIDFNRCV